MKNKRVAMLFVSLFVMAPAVFGGTIGEKRGRLETTAEAKDCEWSQKTIPVKAKPVLVRSQGANSAITR